MAATRGRDAQERLPNSPPAVAGVGGSDGAPEPPTTATKEQTAAPAQTALAETEAADHGQTDAIVCPTCGKPAELYIGTNRHKLGTVVCPRHGRVSLVQDVVAG